MEANFLQNSESIYFDSTSCHSNILEKVSIGSLINVLADPTFATSSYKWYGYDVTLCNVRFLVIFYQFLRKKFEIFVFFPAIFT